MQRCLIRALAVLTLTFMIGSESRALDPSLPPATSELPGWRSLASYRDPILTAKLDKALRMHRGWGRLLDKQHLAVAVVDMNGVAPRFASVNGDVMMYAASLPKIAILLAAYQCFEDGMLPESAEIHADLVEMIRSSSNSAATRMIDRIGMDKIEAVLRDPRYDLYDEDLGGGLWVGKRYAAEGPRHGDPMFNLSHGATADQVSRFYYMLVHGHLVSPVRSAQMLRDLSEPALQHKFVASLRVLAPQARLYRKSGTWQNWHSDSVLVRGEQWRNYILVALVQSPSGAKIVESMVPLVESIIVPRTAAPR